MSASKQKGTKFERLMVDWLNEQLPVTVERRALEGTNDRGDVSGIEGVCCELKNCKRLELGSWLNEAEAEADRDGGSLPILIHKRRGQSHPASQFVTMPAWAFVELLKGWFTADPPLHPKALERRAELEHLINVAQEAGL